MHIVENAIIATKVWEKFIKSGGNKHRISKFFHLRPTTRGVTVITTLSGYEMRGITGLRSEKELLDLLEKINKQYEVLTSLKESRKDAAMKGFGFPVRAGVRHRKLEEKVQATMINTMSRDKNLQMKIGAVKTVQFIASELIFERGKHRVDIVGCDGQDVYFFELKKDRTKAVGQIRDYIDYYSEKSKNSILRKLLENYPINPVKRFGRLLGVMVMEHSENSAGLKDWRKLANTNGIRILFYKPSLAYEDIA